MAVLDKLKGLVQKRETLSAVDIGSSGVKLIEIDTSKGASRVVKAGMVALGGDVFSNYAITQVERVAEQVAELLQNQEVVDRRVATSVPGPSAFTKRVKTARASFNELSTNIRFEAGSFIPHNIENVRLDFHILGPTGKNQLDVLVVAVKNEVVEGLLGVFDGAGLQVAVIDVDYYALQNCFELNYPDEVGKTVALINVGTKYSIVNICQGGQSLFTGDIQVGGKQFTDALAELLSIPSEQAELVKRGQDKKRSADEIAEALRTAVDEAAIELNRQLSFFWNASGADQGIERIYLSGGGALTPGLLENLAEKTGMPCEFLDPFRKLELAGVDAAQLETVRPLYAIATGLAVRAAGDREIPELD